MRNGSPERSWSLPAAILAGLFLIALSIAFTFRWTTTPASPLVGIIRFDRWTGDAVFCAVPVGQGTNRLKCGD